ncbi:HisA/HisF-related TIM barrel protein [Antarcticirhabdus aurantiaca]|uniref:HisA/HisF-related TIM barrel protein n=1 Tax=Antarcticirhabdus aurantiaca TaxID=2606717 RepID=A0ACD4NTU4_9HYPH|nr:HisA/HisF-related TIM barrel protein [Antarcticirhabdus aurantiaca]WAJ30233.1 HisA/HisF-related TIM barrel protein [Jeongeuplla avenae]
MRIVPVLDIKNGVVVRGVRGNRGAYRPIETPLCAGSAPVDVMAGLDALAGPDGFPEAYLADLNAIEGGAPNLGVLDDLAAAFPKKRFWLDAGIRSAAEVERWVALGGIVPVIGSETLRSAGEMRRLAGRNVVLSLDFWGDQPLGDPALFADPALWPARVIVMTLARVGSGEGPDLDRLRAVRALADGRSVFAAGGLRNAGDLDALARAGAAGILVSSALHEGRIAAQALRHGG